MSASASMNGSSGPSTVLTGAKRLREMLADPSKIVVAPGVYDGLTARIALATGFDCLYMTGAGTSMSRLGMADLGLATMDDMVRNASMIAALSPQTPLIADADTGYGGPIMVTRTVTAYARAGVAALHIEDQVQQKRCGHLMGKQLTERDDWYARLRAAVQARDAAGSDMLVIARTDAAAVLGFDEAVERLRGALAVGVDALFLEALASHEQARQATEAFKGTPMLLNMVPGGKTPDASVDQARQLGFRIIIYPAIALTAVVDAVSESMRDLKETGWRADKATTGVRTPFELCGLKELIEIDKRAGGSAYNTI